MYFISTIKIILGKITFMKIDDSINYHLYQLPTDINSYQLSKT